MANKLNVKCVYKHNIIHVNKSKKYTHQIVRMLVCVCMMLLGVLYGKHYNKEVYNRVCYVIAPTKSLYSDNADVMLVNMLTKDLKIMLPVKICEYVVADGAINITVGADIMLVSPENGVITNTGFVSDNTKYVEISFAGNVMCRIDNIDILGVKVGDIVKKGKDIATLRANSMVRMTIFENGNQIVNLQVSKNIVSWTN